MPIEYIGHQTEAQKERARKALARIPMMIDETVRTIERYSLLDDGKDLILQDFMESAQVLQDNLSTREDRDGKLRKQS